MKVVCVSNEPISVFGHSIKVGETYDVIQTKDVNFKDEKHVFLRIICDDGSEREFHERFFITLDEFRLKKLDELGI